MKPDKKQPTDAEVLEDFEKSLTHEVKGHHEWYENSHLRVATVERIRYLLSTHRQPVMYARDLDGTGSLHPCAKGDEGAIPLYR